MNRQHRKTHKQIQMSIAPNNGTYSEPNAIPFRKCFKHVKGFKAAVEALAEAASPVEALVVSSDFKMKRRNVCFYLI